MARITDSERGARIAQRIASDVLNQHKGPQLSLFKPRRLRKEVRELWRGIAAAAAEEIADQQLLRAYTGACRD